MMPSSGGAETGSRHRGEETTEHSEVKSTGEDEESVFSSAALKYRASNVSLERKKKE